MVQSVLQFLNRIFTMKTFISAVFIIAIAGSLNTSFPAYAGGGAAPDLNAGRTLAESRCAHCHAVGREDESPIAAAPPFRHLGRKWPVDNLAEALAEGIVVGHPAMPAFAFSPPEIDDFLGWLQEIQEK